MSKYILPLLLLLIITLPAGAAITEFTEDYTDGVVFAWSPNPTGGTFNGSGQYVMDNTDMIYRTAQDGDFRVHMDIINVNMGAANYVLWTYQWYEYADSLNRLQFWLQRNNGTGTDTWLYVGNDHGGGFSTKKWENFGTVNSLSFEFEWTDSSGGYILSVAVNGGVMNPWFTDTGWIASSLPLEYMYAGTNDGSVALDYYSISESTPPPPDPCVDLPIGDINKDCRVDFEDLEIFLLYWLG